MLKTLYRRNAHSKRSKFTLFLAIAGELDRLLWLRRRLLIAYPLAVRGAFGHCGCDTPRSEGRDDLPGQRTLDQRACLLGLLPHDMAAPVEDLDHIATVVGQQHRVAHHLVGKYLAECAQEQIKIRPRARRYRDGIGIEREVHLVGIVEQVNFVERRHTRLLGGAQLAQHVVYRLALLDGVLVRGVYHFQQHIRLDNLFERAAEMPRRASSAASE